MINNFAFIKSNRKVLKLNFDDIVFIKGLGNYVEIFTSGKEKHIYYKSLKKLIDRLPEEFMRIHNSYIINLTHVEAFEENHVIIAEKKIPVAKSYRDCLESRIEELLL